jgi:hypothetical protein
MIIEESDFRLETVDDTTPLFDLELLHTVNKGKSNERSEFKVVAYGITLDNALKRVIYYRLNNENKDKAITLAQFLKRYIQENNKLIKALENGAVSN